MDNALVSVEVPDDINPDSAYEVVSNAFGVLKVIGFEDEPQPKVVSFKNILKSSIAMCKTEIKELHKELENIQDELDTQEECLKKLVTMEDNND